MANINISSNHIKIRHYNKIRTVNTEAIIITRCNGYIHTTDTTKVAGVDRYFVNCESGIYIKTILGSAYMRHKLDIELKQTFIHESKDLLCQRLTIRA